MPAHRLVLVDGNAMVYRSFFAIRELSTADGRPTNAVFGTVRALRQLREITEPTHWGVAFDGGRPAERMEVLPTYKAQRAPMPEGMWDQFEPVEEYLDAAEIPWTRVDGQEADDIIATLALAAASEGADVLIFSADKDFYQLVNDRIHVLSPAAGKKEMDPPAVEDKTGVPPECIVSWLSLIGDASDNIPGVPGVGQKTATKLLQQFGSLEAMWSGLDGVASDRIRTALSEHRDVVERNVQLIRLRGDCECPLEWKDMTARSEDPGRLLPFLRKMEFATMVREMEEPGLL